MISAQEFFSMLANIAHTQNNKNLAEKAKSRMGSSMPNSVKNIQIFSFINDIRDSLNSSPWILTVSEFFSNHYFDLNNAEQIKYARWLAYLMSGDWLPENTHKNNDDATYKIFNTGNGTLEEELTDKSFLAYNQICHEFSFGFISTSKLLTFSTSKKMALSKLNSVAFKRILLASEGAFTDDLTIYKYDPLHLAICLNDQYNNNGNNFIIDTLIGDIRKMSFRDSSETSTQVTPYITIESIANLSSMKCKYSTKKEIFTHSCELQLLLLQQFLERHESLRSTTSLLTIFLKYLHQKSRSKKRVQFYDISKMIYRQQESGPKRIELMHHAKSLIMLVRYIECSCLLLNHQALVTNKALIIYQYLSENIKLGFLKQKIAKIIMQKFFLLYKSFTYRHKENQESIPYGQNNHVEMVNRAELIINQVCQHHNMSLFHELTNTYVHKQKLLQSENNHTEYSLLDIIILKTLTKEESSNILNPKVKVLMAKIGMLSFSDAINDETLTEDDRCYLLQYFSEAL